MGRFCCAHISTKGEAMPESKFPLGQVVITRIAMDALHPDDVKSCLQRHANGDWGDLGEADQHSNEIALAQGLRLFSAYDDRTGCRFWIITEADRSATTILLPDDY
jgi:hypothetical protein